MHLPTPGSSSDPAFWDAKSCQACNGVTPSSQGDMPRLWELSRNLTTCLDLNQEPSTALPPSRPAQAPGGRARITGSACCCLPPACPPHLSEPDLYEQTQRMHFPLWRKTIGALEPGLMRCNLEEELAPDGWSPQPGQTDRRVIIHTQLQGTSSKLKDAALKGSRPLPRGGQQV